MSVWVMLEKLRASNGWVCLKPRVSQGWGGDRSHVREPALLWGWNLVAGAHGDSQHSDRASEVFTPFSNILQLLSLASFQATGIGERPPGAHLVNLRGHKRSLESPSCPPRALRPGPGPTLALSLQVWQDELGAAGVRPAQ